MREIKFRGKRIDNGEWVYGSLLLIDNKAYIYPLQYGDLNDVDFGKSFVDVISKTVGQYTGLKDKNGKEIYEGDVVKCYSKDEEWFIGIVKIGEFKLRHNTFFTIDNYQEYYGIYIIVVSFSDDVSSFFNVNKHIPFFKGLNVEAIGNIYDNSKILEDAGDE